MARIKVRMFATVREAAGASEVELEASSMEELLESLGQRFGRKMSEMLSRASGGENRLVVLVNGRNAQLAGGRHLRLNEGDDVALFPPVSGG
ncbi:MAG: MoaD family protein [Candidatus Thermoplasmatota archaeon]|nr:MoaD family protein [Candidatus Thermoplasmatota archaeon]